MPLAKSLPRNCQGPTSMALDYAFPIDDQPTNVSSFIDSQLTNRPMFGMSFVDLGGLVCLISLESRENVLILESSNR